MECVIHFDTHRIIRYQYFGEKKFQKFYIPLMEECRDVTVEGILGIAEKFVEKIIISLNFDND